MESQERNPGRKELQKEQTSDSEPKLIRILGQLVQGDPSESTERQQLEAERTDQRSELSTTGEKGGEASAQP